MIELHTVAMTLRILNFILALVVLITTASVMRILSGRLNTACKIFLTTIAILVVRTGLAIAGEQFGGIWRVSIGVTDTLLIAGILAFVIHLDGTFRMLARIKQDKGR